MVLQWPDPVASQIIKEIILFGSGEDIVDSSGTTADLHETF